MDYYDVHTPVDIQKCMSSMGKAQNKKFAQDTNRFTTLILNTTINRYKNPSIRFLF